ncbi:MAG: peptidoglycan DD-metalloendopeptidase family protein [Candidatus Zixiibacteriota bacterium]
MWRVDLGRNVDYFHTAIDIPGGEMEPVIAVESGYVKAIFTLFNNSSYHWRIIIADSSGEEPTDGWLYAHLIQQTISANVGDYILAGDTIGLLVEWPYPETPIHLHFARISFAGDSTSWANGFWDYQYAENPLNYLTPAGDTSTPYIENALGSQLFAFCLNGTDQYFEEEAPISGEVDIICSAYDNGGYNQYRSCPYQLEYKIEGDSSLPWTNSFEFSGTLDSYNGIMEELSRTVYKYDSRCSTTYTNGNYNNFFILTNTDGDSIIEADDAQYCWRTQYFHNGDYKVFVRLSDFEGNSTIDSMIVAVENNFQLFGTILHSESGIPFENVVIKAILNGAQDTTDINGNYNITNIGGGSQIIQFSKDNYFIYDTTLLMTENKYQDFQLDFEYMCGDANNSTNINILDITYIIAFLYKSGQAPIPVEAGDANGNDVINILDITYLIAFLYKLGPEPICPPIN